MRLHIARAAAACAVALFVAPASLATNSRPELELVMRDLLEWLPGEYSTHPQLYLERRLGPMPEGEHEDWYRIFAKIDAPQIGPNVIYGELRVGGPDGPIITGQQILYIVSIDDEHRAVNVSGRRISDAEKFKSAHLRPEVWKDLSIDARTGGNCPFRWRRHGVQLRGILNDDGKCQIVSKVSGNKMSFDAEWILNENELWVFDNNYVEGQGLFMGREDRTHTRLSKVRKFDCTASYLEADRPTTRTFRVHDRGGRAWIRPDGKGGGEQIELFRGLVPVGSPATLKEQMWLALYDGKTEDPVARTAIDGVADRLALESKDTRVMCELERGKRVFTQCLSCHTLDPSGKHVAAGPNLRGIVGRRAGTLPGFEYSPALRDSGIRWTEEELARFLEKPSRRIPGTIMMFVGLKQPADRAALICYLREEGSKRERS
jgi:cytochrome c